MNLYDKINVIDHLFYKELCSSLRKPAELLGHCTYENEQGEL